MSEQEFDFSGISFNKDDIAQAAAPRVLAEGYYHARVADCAAQVSKTGWAMLVPTLHPLREAGKADSASPKDAMRAYIMCPFFVNEKAENATPAGKRADKISQYSESLTKNLRALVGEEVLPYPPRWDDKRKAFVSDDGAVVSREDRKQISLDINEKAWNLAKSFLNNPDSMTEYAAFIRVVHEQYNDSTQARVGGNRLLSMVPKDNELKAVADWYVVADSE